MELNSIEAIKTAVQSGLGAAFVSTTAIEKELQMGMLHRAQIEEVVVKRMLSVIINPNRYRSKAAEAFCRDILPHFNAHYPMERVLPCESDRGHRLKSVAVNTANHHLVTPEIES
jgi:DNA-binding transcriptional LysR family regulator